VKYIPVELTENVNVSKTHPLVELAWLLGGVTLLLVVGYVLLGVGVELAAEHIPIEAEIWLGGEALDEFDSSASQALQARLDALLQTLPADDPLHRYPFRVHLVDSPEVNALALPGGNILVFAGLLREVASENELSLVLAHELGHYAHRDHLKQLGRGFGVTFLTSMVFGRDSGVTALVGNLLMSFEARYSQKQEGAADAYGLQLLVARYGHAGGATDFFTRLAEKSGSRWAYVLASHPHPRARIERLVEAIRDGAYPVEAVTRLGEDLQLPEADEAAEAGRPQGSEAE